MALYKSDFLNLLNERGYIHQCSNFEGLDEKLINSMVSAYIGFDATAKSLHIGNLLGIMMLRKFQQTGHKPIVLMGGGTTKIGDPSGKDEGRKLLTADDINNNITNIKDVFNRLIDFDNGENAAIMANNDDWLDKLKYIEFLRDYGKHFSIARMLSFESVKQRLDREQPLSFLEFNYMIFQAYDFLELYRRYGCKLQMGGSDQWGNIVNGIELGRRSDQAELYALTTPLLTTSSGAKMGKTAKGAVWLNSDMFSPYDYWQYWRDCEDADVGKFLRLFTEIEIDEITRLEKLEGSEINEAKKVLATKACELIHGKDEANKAQNISEATFEGGGLSSDLPTISLKQGALSDGVGVLSAFVTAGLVKSNGEARRMLKGGGVRINDKVIQDERLNLNESNLNDDGYIKLSLGKKKHVLLKG